VIADLGTLLTALYVELTDRIIRVVGFLRRGPGKAPEVTDAELVCLGSALGLMRADCGHREALGAVQLGRVRLLPEPFPLVLGCKLLLICTCDGTVTGFSLANPQLYGEREEARQALKEQSANVAPPSSRTRSCPARRPMPSSLALTWAWPSSARPARRRVHRGISPTGCGSASKRSSGR
jgi:hypothetical protein